MGGKIKPKPGQPGQGKVGNLPSDDGKPNTNKEKEKKQWQEKE